MATITTRAGKGSPLTNTEVDNNFTNLNTAKYESGNNVTFGTINATGFQSSANINTTGDSGLGIKNGSRLGFDQSGTRSWTVKAANGNLEFYSGDGNGNLRFQSNKLWHAGNDGSGSGLDADTVDGIHANRIPYALTDSLGTTNTFTTDGGIGSNNIARSMFFRDNGGQFGAIGFHASHATNANYAWQMASTSYSDGSKIKARVKNNGTWTDPVTIWNSGNDGSGSGLDADTLDGVQGGNFLRSNATDSASGAITFSGDCNFTSTGLKFSSHYYSNLWASEHVFQHIYPSGGNGTTNTQWNLRTWDGSAQDARVLTANGNGTFKWGSNTIWHAGNDGSGSGLDADTLDGSHASSFASSSHNHSGVYLPIGSRYTGNASSISVSSYRLWDVSTSNDKPSGALDGLLLTGYWDSSSWATQQYHDFHTNDLFLRNKYNTSWQAWDKVWTSGNDGSGSGLDADTLDGQHETAFVRVSTGNSSDLNSSGHYRAGMFGWYDQTSGRPGDSYGQGISIVSSGHSHNNSNNWITQLAFGTNQNTAYFRGKTNAGTWGSWRTFFHTGNDGSGSGLDADTVDGIQASSFLRSDANDTATGIITFNNTPILAGTSGNEGGEIRFGAPTGGVYSAFNLDNYQGHFRVHTLGSGKNFTIIGVSGNTIINQNIGTVWGSGNDGSGSGLDADTVDGIQASSFVRKDSAIPQNPVGTTYGNGVTSAPTNMIRQTVGDNDGWRIYGEAPSSNDVKMIFEIVDDIESGDTWVFRNKKTYSPYTATEPFKITGSGTVTALGNVTAYSDARLKENIETIPSALEKVSQIRGVTFTRNDQEDKETRHAGVIAQEVEKVLPEVVSEDSLGVKNVAYGNMVGLLIEAIKELKAEIEELKGGK